MQLTVGIAEINLIVRISRKLFLFEEKEILILIYNLSRSLVNLRFR